MSKTSIISILGCILLHILSEFRLKWGGLCLFSWARSFGKIWYICPNHILMMGYCESPSFWCCDARCTVMMMQESLTSLTFQWLADCCYIQQEIMNSMTFLRWIRAQLAPCFSLIDGTLASSISSSGSSSDDFCRARNLPMTLLLRQYKPKSMAVTWKIPTSVFVCLDLHLYFPKKVCKVEKNWWILTSLTNSVTPFWQPMCTYHICFNRCTCCNTCKWVSSH